MKGGSKRDRGQQFQCAIVENAAFAMYLSHLGEDLQYAVQHSNSVVIDGETALNWIEGCFPCKLSRHVEVRS